ncbi:hypothetical protein ACJJTC_012002 [Scirpophaga incertulas]
MTNVRLLILLVALITISECKKLEEVKQTARKFPDGFLFGTATASYQVEGAWNVDGKSESIWDYLTHTNPEAVKDMSNGDIADNSYYQYKRDVEMMRELGLDYYRFSLSWPRILPTSFPDYINPAGIEYYNNLIDEMLKYNIQPMVTLFHWDMPQKLQEMGGWNNPHIVDWYTDFAKVAFEMFGDRVKYWITMNEPYEICHHGYGNVNLAPMLNLTGVAEYLCAKNLLVAHAKAYHLYDKMYRPSQKGKLFITIQSPWFEPENEGETETARDIMQFDLGQFAHPIFSKNGDFPEVMKDKVAAKSKAQGYQRSRLPEFTAEEIEMLRGSSDFFGLNHYSTHLVHRNNGDTVYAQPSNYDDMNVVTYQPSDWVASATDRNKVVPWGFYKLLMWIKEEYDNPPVIITENGYSSLPGLDDIGRVDYYRGYLNAMLDAIEDGVDVRAYTAWSLMDNFEWLQGYTVRFGLYEVDYEDPERKRTPRKSAFVFKEMVRTRSLDNNYEPDTTEMTIDEDK